MKQIPLTQGKFALVDDEDYNKIISMAPWHVTHFGYASHCQYILGSGRKNNRNKPILMHRVITKCPDSMMVDHINGDKLDNRRDNLRICTMIQNQRNRGPTIKNKSGYKGVSWCNTRNRWVAQIKINKDSKKMLTFKCKHEAAKTYNKWALEFHGEFAYVNIITI